MCISAPLRAEELMVLLREQAPTVGPPIRAGHGGRVGLEVGPRICRGDGKRDALQHHCAAGTATVI